jgi:hypothetical protein
MDEDFLLREAARIRRRAGHPRPDEEQP